MATLVLRTAGAALGGLFGPVGALIGQAVGALAGAAVDRAVFGGSRTVRGTPLDGARIPGAEEGDGINRVYGTARIAGTLFWATRFEERRISERAGGKASGPTVESFEYFANFAIGLCEGEIAGIRRVWADGKELDLTDYTLRVYGGTADQLPDPLIEAKQGSGKAPAYRGLAYAVFEQLPLERFGSRIPTLHFEVIRPIGRLEGAVRAVTVIPASTEHGYDLRLVTAAAGPGETRKINRNVLFAETDWIGSIDELQAVCPDLRAVGLVVAWFGTDLRAGDCLIRPGVETNVREEESMPWSVGGIARADAYVVSTVDGAPAYGGSPSDGGVVKAIEDLRARGLAVFLFPFLMMDIAAGNGLSDPYGRPEQPPYPWRGRITCHPAAGEPQTTDKTASARQQVTAFSGPATPSDFTVVDGIVAYGGSDWGFRRLILHYAHLAVLAGGVDGFVIGSEMRGLTRLRDDNGAFPFVEQLVDLADAVKTILGAGTLVTYGADWSEYFGYQPADGTADVFFNLDPLWASPSIDAIGIDNYMPLSDWQDGDLVAGNPDGFVTASDPAGLRAAVAGGEGFDWYYASQTDRDQRLRSPITDGAAGKPWVFRYKDLQSWWSNPHYDRPGGVEAAQPTAWVPQSKPIWLTELGCPAVDKGANQPNVFPDPKSSENALPYHSTGARNDQAQRRFLEAHLDHWTSAAAPAGMVDPDRIFLWTWDARPYPGFPYSPQIWRDGPNWQAGHWLNGRLGSAIVPDLIAAILADHDIASAVVDDVEGDVTGYVQSGPASARQMLEPLIVAFQIDVVETVAGLRFQSRTRRAAAIRIIDALAERADAPLMATSATNEAELASEAVIDHYDPADDYESAAALSRRLATGSRLQERLTLAATVERGAATAAADLWLRDHWAARRTVRFALPPFDLGVEPGDAVRLAGDIGGDMLVARIEDGAMRQVTARGYVTAALPASAGRAGGADDAADRASSTFDPLLLLLDLPVLDGMEAGDWARAAAYVKPWRAMALSSSPSSEGYVQRLVIERPVRIGTLAAALGAGASGRFDRLNAVDVDLAFGAFASADTVSVINGANALAVRSSAGPWEILQFRDAEETAPGRWRLTMLLRGQLGTEDAAGGAAVGADVVAIDGAVQSLGLLAGEAGLTLNWIAEPAGRTAGETAPLGFAGGLRARTPLSPVHLRAVRLGDGSVRVTWVRRSRFNADSWLGSDIPLDEPSERYRIEVLDGAAVLRSSEVTAPQWHYQEAEETADFGGPQSVLTLRVRQIGMTIGDGLAAERSIAL